MKVLPPASYRDRIAEVLGELNAEWATSDVDPGSTTYVVSSSDLKGVWSERGADADERIFASMVLRLDDAWRGHLNAYRTVARAMRRVGR